MTVTRCRYRRCGAAIQPHRLFCWPHWRLVPVRLRRRLARVQWAAFRDANVGDRRQVLRLVNEAILAIDAATKREEVG